MKRLTLFTAATLLAACGQTPQEDTTTSAAAPFSAADIRTQVESDHRNPDHSARDRFRNPVETLRFFELAPTDHVIEINPGTGWYAEILAPLLHDRGHYVAAIIDPEIPDAPAFVPRLAEIIEQLLDSDNARYGQAEIRRYNPAQPTLGEPNSADRVLTFRNVHSWYNAGNAEVMFAAFHEVLKPGGVLGVVQHRAAEGADPQESGQSGYLSETTVITLAENAGFRLVERSEINANPEDTRDHPRGVWTLPPSLALGEEGRAHYEAIGESDRMTLRFVKE